MGYETVVSGSIDIEPPIPWGELRKRKWPVDEPDAKDIYLKLDETKVDAEDGVMVLRKAVAIVPAFYCAYKAHKLFAHVQEVIDAFGKGRSFSGYLECHGETPGDLWRVYVRNGAAVEVQPEIVWPDE